MGLKYSIQATIPYDMADVNSHVRLPQLMALAMQVSGMQSIELGMADDKVLADYGLVWIISDHTLTIERLPRFLETITIETEALSHNRYFCYRIFRIFDEKGQQILEMTTTFMLMDKESRKVQPVVESIVAPFESTLGKKMLRGPKYPSELENASSRDYQVRFFDLDMNGHVNNGKYLEWVYEALGAEFLTAHVPRQVDIKYVREVMADSTVTTAVSLEGLVSQHQIISDGILNAQARIEWRNL